jgi:adenosylcobinamide-GDP ribazoletransferase
MVLETPLPFHETVRSAAPLTRLLRGVFVAFFAALQFLTIAPALVRRPFTGAELGRAVAFFPLVGLLLGAALLGLDRVLAWVFPISLASALLLASWVVLTGALHLDGFLDSCDGLFGGRTPEERLRILRDPRIGAFGACGGVLLILIKYEALTALVARTTALLLAPMLGRWGMAMAIVLFPYARPQGLGSALKEHARGWHVAVATLAVAAVAYWLGGWPGLLILPGCAACTWIAARFALRRLPGLTGDLYGALCELLEVVVLLAVVAVERRIHAA